MAPKRAVGGADAAAWVCASGDWEAAEHEHRGVVGEVRRKRGGDAAVARKVATDIACLRTPGELYQERIIVVQNLH